MQRLNPIDSRSNPLGLAVTHQVYGWMLRAVGRSGATTDTELDERDRGAVSLEQVLWFVAAGVAVAGIAYFLYGRIAEQAGTEIETPVSVLPVP